METSWLHLADLDVSELSPTHGRSIQHRPTRRLLQRELDAASQQGSSGDDDRSSVTGDNEPAACEALILNLSNSRFEWSADRLHNHVAPEYLTHLNLSQNNLRAVPADILRPLRGLKMLNLSHNFIDSMWGLQSQWQLEYLDLSSNWIDTVTGLDQCSKLQVLDLAKNQVR